MSSKIQDNLSSEFDAFSVNYTADMVDVVPHYEHLMQCFDACLPTDFAPQKILDLGAGNGNSTAAIIARFPNAHYTFLDASSEMLGICEQRFSHANTKTIQSYFADVEYGEDQFDLILAGFSLHHCKADEKRLLFKRLNKALTLGGVLAMSDLFISKSDDAHPQLLADWEHFICTNDPSGEKWLWLKEHYDAFDSPHNLESQREWLFEAGFSNVEIAWREGYWMHVLAR